MKLMLVFVLISLSVTIMIIAVQHHVVKRNVFNQKLEEQRLVGEKIVHRIMERLYKAETLAATIANLGETELADHDEYKKLLPKMLNDEAMRNYIAGGGLWPEPYMLDPSKERASLFWGRDSAGKLQYYDDYNLDTGQGYHNEEWYVPAPYANPGKCYWSQSYVDPYSAEPMVTCTVAMRKNEAFYGASTVDIMLSGLSAHIEEDAQLLGGYGYILDRNNRFLTYRDDALVRVNPDGDSAEDKTYIEANAFAKKFEAFHPIADKLGKINRDLVQQVAEERKDQLKIIQEDLFSRSYQIDRNAAQLIASILLSQSLGIVENQTRTIKNYVMELDHDMYLKEDVFVHVFFMPQTFWKVVLVVPKSRIDAPVNELTSFIIFLTVFFILFAFAAMLFSIRHILIGPLRAMSKQLKSNKSHDVDSIVFLNDKKADELGQIAHWYNLRTDQFCTTQKLLEEQLNKRRIIEAQMQDYTKELEQERIKLRQAKQKAEEASYAKSRFLSTMSHELRTPLNAVIGISEILLEDDDVKSAHHKDLGIIHKSARLLLTIIGDILDFSKIESGDLILDIKPYHFEPFISDVIDLMSSTTMHEHIHIDLNYNEGIGGAYVFDQIRLKQVLINLIGNSIKFTEDGAVTVNVVKTTSSKNHDKIRFEVIDTGIGIPEDKQDAIFDHFMQADISTTRKYGGTGLGLAICKKIIELMGGEIGVISKEGEGALFWFELDLLIAAEKECTKRRQCEACHPQKQDSEPRTILVAEDSEFSQAFITRALDKLGHNYDIVEDGLSAIEHYQTNNYDIIFMDCMMPKMDGYNATQRIRDIEIETDHHTPIIALTANALEEDKQKCLDIGMDDYATKPMKFSTIEEMIIKYTRAN